MATTTALITISSSDLLSDELAVTTTSTLTQTTTATGIEHTTGLARKTVTSTAKGTASGQVTLYTADDFAAIAYLYIKNTDATATDYVYVYKDGGTDNLLKLAGGDFAFLPLIADDTLKAWATTSGTVVEWMVIGTDQ